MFTRMGATQRDSAFAAPFVAFALATIGYGIFGLIAWPPHSWTLVLTLIAAVSIAGSFQMHVGRTPGFPLVGMAITMLAIPPTEHSPLFGVCIWAIGLLVSQLVLRRDVLQAFYVTGLNSLAAFAFVAIESSLSVLGVWRPFSFVLASIGFYAIFLLGEFARQWVRNRPARGFGLATLSLPRAGVVVLIVSASSTLIHAFDTTVIPWLEHDAGARRTSFIVLLAALIFYVIGQRIRYAETERRLTGILDAAIELPHVTGESLAATLQDRARAIVQTNQVTLRSTGPGPGEIGSEVSLEPGTTQYLVVGRKVDGMPFSRDDARAINTLANMASEAARAQNEVISLERRANTDTLTGLPNYGAFQLALDDANENRPYHDGVGLLFIDLDNFKHLNDTFGHPAGDELLRVVAERLQSASGGGDFVARVGGDEFVVILTGKVSLEQAKEDADRIIEAISQPLTLEGSDMVPVVSAGLAYSSHRELSAQTLVEDADRTMLQVKRSRRKGEKGDSSVVGISSHRSSRTNDIVARAIRSNRLSLAFQPIVSIDDGQIWAFEALVRYIDPELGPISPPSLVARAKSLGLLNELTMQVVTKALTAADEFQKLEPSITCMTVNLELNQISDNELGPFIRETASARPHLSLCVELNERSMRSLTDGLRHDAEKLQQAGVIIALDDYGSDDSSVGALVRSPMDILKIDRSLIDDLGDPRQREFIKALQGFGTNLNHQMVVEGIEHPEMVDIMTELGVRNAQGYYYGRPLSFALTMDRLKRHGTQAVVT
ncbi:putative bifunctional diguanylate cyclase/phosphodiesterase [Leucobacter sp. Z1108]|uniref:putative bifunctional diguanylate cyclase/phosphodiesterase n=1 Tax=Leucobacter sp. Z1108 TaxID=3439066 RepID=UPI003F2B1C27